VADQCRFVDPLGPDYAIRLWPNELGRRKDGRRVSEATGQERDHAVAVLFAAHYPGLVRMTYLLTSDNALAEELAQEAFVALWKSWDRLRDSSAALAYLRGTVANLARMSLRRRMVELKHRVTGSGEVVDRDAGGRLDLERAVAQLLMRKRSCVVLRYFLDLSEEETARTLGVSAGTVKSSTARALKDLERHLDGIGYERLRPGTEGNDAAV
jgi:RNA polymerase sigma-70 factor (sigma-E family)